MVVVENKIEYDSVMNIVKQYSEDNYIATKKTILNELLLPVNKDTRRLLTKVMKELKARKLVRTDYGIHENGYLCGRGYVLYDS